MKDRCQLCRGRGKLYGLGGIEKTCQTCDGKGIPKLTEKIIEAAKALEPKKKGRPPKQEIVSATEAFESMGVPKAVIDEVITKDLSEATPDFPAKEQPQKPMLAGYSDDFIKAILDEPKHIDPFAWRLKHSHVKELFGISPISNTQVELVSHTQRAAIREQYAMQKQIAARTIDLQKYQDQVAESDVEYLNYKASEKKRLEATSNA